MGHWEATGKSNDRYTPPWIFDALGCEFDLDVAHPTMPTHVPCRAFIYADSLKSEWHGFVWMNPPFEGRNEIEPWLAKFFEHGNGIALTPDRTSAPWFREHAPKALSVLFLPKVRFLRPDGSEGKSPSNGTALMAAGIKGHAALKRASHLGTWMFPIEASADVATTLQVNSVCGIAVP